MKNILLTFVFISGSLAANANSLIEQNVNSELAKVETEMSACGAVRPVNKLITKGKSNSRVVDALMASLENSKLSSHSKAGAAMALGHIGDARAISALQLLADSASDSMLKSISQDAISIIKGEFKSEGKVYVYSFAIKKLKTDCESGKSIVVK